MDETTMTGTGTGAGGMRPLLQRVGLVLVMRHDHELRGRGRRVEGILLPVPDAGFARYRVGPRQERGSDNVSHRPQLPVAGSTADGGIGQSRATGPVPCPAIARPSRRRASDRQRRAGRDGLIRGAGAGRGGSYRARARSPGETGEAAALRATGKRECAPDDGLQINLWGRKRCMDCFVASLLAMTICAPLTSLPP